jgi:hypothetical protein
MQCIYMMEYHSAIKKNEILSFITIWMKLEIIMLSEISQAQKNSTAWSHSYVESKVDLMEVESTMVVTRGWGRQSGKEGLGKSWSVGC